MWDFNSKAVFTLQALMLKIQCLGPIFFVWLLKLHFKFRLYAASCVKSFWTELHAQSNNSDLKRDVLIMSKVYTHVGQLPFAPLCEQVAHLLQNSPPPLSRFGKVRLIAFITLACILQHACDQKSKIIWIWRWWNSEKEGGVIRQ